MRIAMWSGPRNISTAMMRAWENRADCRVIDEPFYGYYLHTTGLDHPGADEVIADQGTDWQSAVDRCMAPLGNGETIFFQKHMIMHLLAEVDREWLHNCEHLFLVRHPAEVVASYSQVRGTPTLRDIGFKELAELFVDMKSRREVEPLVIDANEFLQAPEQQLRQVCAHLGLVFSPAMLSWPSGSRDSDGVWATYWYRSVQASTGFAPYQARSPQLTSSQQALIDQAMPYFEQLWAHRLRN